MIDRQIPVFDDYLVFFNDQPCRKSICKFPMNQCIYNCLTKNYISQANSLIAFKIKGIRKVFSDKCHQTVITIYQVCPDLITVVVAIGINNPHQRIGFVSRQDTLNYLIFSENQRRGKCIS